MDLLDLCQQHDMGLDVFRDQSGTTGLSVYVGGEYHFLLNDLPHVFNQLLEQIFSSKKRKAIFDMRKLSQLNVDPSHVQELYDVNLIYGGDKTLFSLAKEHLDEETYQGLTERDSKFKSHIRACKTAQVDMTSHSILSLVPGNFIQTMLKLRCQATLRLLEKKVRSEWLEIERYRKDTHPLAIAMMVVEKNRIKVDFDLIEEKLDLLTTAHVRSFLLNMQQLVTDDGYVKTKYNVAGVRTGRLRTDGKEGRIFNPMGIPKGLCRETIVSRYLGGKIVSVDYNAIDYRCIVASTDDEDFKKKYEDCDDFHRVNTGLLVKDVTMITPEVRTAVKGMTYVTLYGGSPETIVKQTGMSMGTIMKLIPILEQKLAPCIELREKLHEKSIRDGYVVLPNGRKIPTERGDHAGKVLGLYAQGYSSYRFEKAILKIIKLLEGKRTKLIFTVHDEIVLDEHPDEQDCTHQIADVMEESEDGWPLVVSISKGKNYREATE